MNAISIRGLNKWFGSTHALDDLNLDVAEGEVLGLLGPNGAGKSTAIRVVLGLLRADAGVIELLGGDPWLDTASLHQRLAYVPGDVNLWPQLSGGEVIDLFGRLRGGLDENKLQDLLDRFHLNPSKKGRAYSKGNRQKVAIVAALASNVELLILDEPTSGLDPVMEAVFQDCIKAESAEGRTVLLSSHIMSEVEALCDRVSMIRAGHIVESGTLAELRHLTRNSVTATLDRIPDDLETWHGVHDDRADGSRVQFDVDSDHIGSVMSALSGYGIQTLVTQPPSLEELFLRHYDRGEQ